MTHLSSFLPQVLERGEKIELLVDKTDNLRSQVGALSFKKRKKKELKKNFEDRGPTQIEGLS